MHCSKKTIALAILVSFILIGTAATTPPEQQFKNLKVLPADISGQRLDSIMDAFNRALKVNCDFCHSAPASTFPLAPASNEIDFATDNPMKENARKMMRLTIEINSKYFNTDSTKHPVYLNVVSCNTCHRGNPFPAHE